MLKVVFKKITVVAMFGLVLLLGCWQKAAYAAPEQLILSAGDRLVSVWRWTPEQRTKAVIVFSHGAASAPLKYEALINQWVAQGYQVYAPLHVDSTEHPQREKYQGFDSWRTRIEDMQLLSEQIGEGPYIAAGHSYGALTALVRGGASALVPPGSSAPLADPKVALVLAFSPPQAIPGFIEKNGYASLRVPALIQTGTADIPMGSDASWEGHLDAYHSAATGGQRYALVLDGVDHYFGGAICRPELPGPAQLTELQQAADISLLFIAAQLLKNAEAYQQMQRMLNDKGPVVLLTK